VAQKVSHYQIIKNCVKSYEIRLLRQIQEMTKHYYNIRLY